MDIYRQNYIPLHASERSAMNLFQLAGVSSWQWHSALVGRVCHLDPRAA